MSVLTSDVSNAANLSDGCLSLTAEDIKTYLDLRIDFVNAKIKRAN